MQYSKYDLNAVAKDLSKIFKYKLDLVELPSGDLELMVIKFVSFGRSDNKNITVKDAKDYDKNVKIGDSISLKYEEDNRNTILNMAKTKLENLKAERRVLAETDERLKALTDQGITKGAIICCTVDKISPLGDINMKCSRIPNVKINLPKDQQISEVYDYNSNNEYYVIITRINSIGNSVVLTVSRRSTELVKELIIQKMLTVDTEGIDIKKFARIPDRGSRAFVNGSFSRFLGKGGANVKGISELVNNEFIRFLVWDQRLPQLVINALQFDYNILDIYYPEETPDKRWHIVVDSSTFTRGFRVNVEALTFTKMLTGVQLWVEREDYLEIPHKEYTYEGTLFDGEFEAVKRYYVYKINELGLTTDEEVIAHYKELKITESDKEYVKLLIDSQYAGECPICGATIGITLDYCPECGQSFKTEPVEENN